MRHRLLTYILLTLLTATTAVQGGTTPKAVCLRTAYQENPLGLEEAPTFGWRLEGDADRYGLRQTAYQVVVATSPEELNAGSYCYDTGKVKADRSVGIPYGGTLSPATRYYWQVRVWDEDDRPTPYSEAAWFETGLMGSGWDNAQWIGSPTTPLSKYRSHFTLDYDVQLSDPNRRAVFVFGVQDEDNYLSLEYRIDEADGHARLLLSHVTEGKETMDADEDLTYLIPTADVRKPHHFSLKVVAAQYARKYNIDIRCDGLDVKNSLKPEKRDQSGLPEFMRAYEGTFIVAPYPDEALYTHCRLYGIGFRQPEGEEATFSGIRISYDTWGETLYADTASHTAVGDGRLQTWQPGEDTSAPLLRKAFTLTKPVRRARLYATARGIYEFSINGRRVGQDYLNPGWTDYRRRIFYNTYDVTDCLTEGPNAMGATLGSGWWSDFMGFNMDWQDQYGLRQSLLGKLVVDYADGSRQTIVTDGSWLCYDQGPYVENSLQNGVEYDARREPQGWDTAGYEADKGWKAVAVLQAPADSVKLQAYVGGTIRAQEVLRARSVAQPRPGTYVYDMGVNMVGIPRLHLKGKEGQRITVRYGEMIWPEQIPTNPTPPYTVEMYRERAGLVYTDNYRSALSTDVYTCKGATEGETFEPRLTQHGYRYVQIEGLDAPLATDDVEGLVLHSIGPEQMSRYETSDSLTNQLYQNILWGQKGNFLSVPTDCPQRDERLGWTGDAQVFALSATYNYNVAPFFHRWFYSLRDNQDEAGNYSNYSPNTGVAGQAPDGGGAIGWAEAGVVIPWQVYQQYADLSMIAQHYPSMQCYLSYMESLATDYILPAGGFGDWLSFQETGTQLTNTAFFAYDALLMSRMAKALDKAEDAARYAALYDSIKTHFNRFFVREDGRTRIPKGGQVGFIFTEILQEEKLEDTQTSYILPLFVGLFDRPEVAVSHLAAAIERNGNRLSTGFVGTPYLNIVLSEHGRNELAYTLFQQKACPSWLYPVLQGATTIWERWNSYTKENGFGPVDMNSFNHYSYGAIEEWMMKYTLGIQADEDRPGYKHFRLHPLPGGDFRYIRGSLNTVYGCIESGWERLDDGTTEYRFTVPANTSATLTLPRDARTVQGETGVTNVRKDGETMTMELKSGVYRFSVKEK